MSFINKIDKNNIPNHVAIIMDGNGRWAKEHKKPRVFGHTSGVKSVNSIIEAAATLNVTPPAPTPCVFKSAIAASIVA